MKVRMFVGKLRVRIGEYENTVSLLIVANSPESAQAVLDDAARQYYGDEDTPKEEGGYYANGGEVHVSAQSLNEIGLSTFLELKSLFTVRKAANVTPPDESALEASFAELAQTFTAALNRKEPIASHSQVLNALASAFGHNNWRVLKHKLEQLTEKAAPPMLPSEAIPTTVPPLDNPIAESHKAHRLWVARECSRVGDDKIRFIESRDYTIGENGTGTGWYALLPGQTTFRHEDEAQNYLGFFSTLDDLVDELLDTLDYLFDEAALGLCMVHQLRVLPHHSATSTSRWSWVGTSVTFETAGEAARDALRDHNIGHARLNSSIHDSVETKRRQVAELMLDDYDFGAPVIALNGWETAGELMQCVAFLEQGLHEDSKRVVFAVHFKERSAEPEGLSLT